MEVLCCSGTLDYLQIALQDLFVDPFCSVTLYLVKVVIHQSQVPFHTGTRVFRSLSIHSVRQHHSEACLYAPLAFAAGNVVINDNLCFIREVSKLGFPHDQIVRVALTVAKLEA